MRFNYGRFLFYLSVGSFFCFTWFTTRRRTGIQEDNAQSQLIALYQDLLAAEKRGFQLSQNLTEVLDRLKLLAREQRSSRKLTGGTEWNNQNIVCFPHLSNAYLYLPHLKDHEDSLTPNVILGRGRKGVSLVLGIPTVKREMNTYLINSLSSLLFDLSVEEKDDIVIIVFVAEVDAAYLDSVAHSIKTNFPNEVDSGLLEVVSPSPHFYPSFSQLRETFGDTKERVQWRTKQNLDYSFLMLYAQPKGSYYVQLEDDIVAKLGYLQIMKTFVHQQTSDDWFALEFSQLGFIGKLFRASDVPMLVEFILMFYKDKPIDWLLDHILWVKVCHPEKDLIACNKKKESVKLRYKPSLFQHVGLHSSLKGKVQNLKDKDFVKQNLFKGHWNPQALLQSSMTAYESHTLERAYRGEDFFWGMTPVAGDYIQISFLKPQTLKSYLFRSGNVEVTADKFYNATVEVLPSDSSVLKKADNRQISKDGFIVIGAFVNGVAEGTIDAELQKISAVRLVVQADSDFWVVLSEMHIKV